ncbi:hypothetical protein [Jiangella anatolica]|uniref:Alpha/beta hydrolase n=1 Tax=Jiangella anatolica TaxID=2670374 RepID=A0A2W2BVP9_9ACTN|nr:hypothetical protein [Jiangella anatolica]PZF84018.1 hypothetical protein C1I92_10240 [Jiangella anatolica]
MQPGAVVIVSGPLGPWTGGPPPSTAPYPVVVAAPVADRPPYSVSWLAAASRHLLAAAPASPLVLVAHGTAGPLLPALARTQRAAGRRIGGYVFADATLPRPGAPSHLDLLRAADGAAADAAHDALHASDAGWPPEAAHPGGHDFWTERLPPAPDWPDAPCAYLRTGADVPGVGPPDFWARSAAARGWPVTTLTDGDDVAAALADVIAGLPGATVA